MKPNAKILSAAAAGLIAVGFGVSNLSSSNGNVQLTADFTNASPLVKGNVVRASGVDVGTITKIALQDGHAVVTMSLNPAVLPLHKDATATITTEDLLGERYIDLNRGTPSAPALDSMTLPTAQTARVVDLQDVLNSVNTPTATALSALLSQAGEGLAGNGANTAKTLAALSPTMAEAQKVAGILSSQNQVLGQLIDSAAPVASAVASRNGQSLDHLVSGATAALTAVAQERQALSDALDELPTTISHARASLAQLSGLATPATTTLASLRPVTDNLSAISNELGSFSDAANPALTSLPPVLARANTLLHAAAPVIKALKPASGSLKSVAASAERLSSNALSGSDLTNLMEFIKGWSLATAGQDAISHYFNALAVVTPSALGDTAGGLVPALPKGLLSGVPTPTSPKLPIGTLSNLVSGLTGAPSSKPSSSATGLNQGQEQGLVGSLLGGLL